jgi:hypothetical protein
LFILLVLKMSGLTDHEQELYDRQIRLWGLETQQKLQQTTLKVLNCDALGCEIAKNAVLSGLSVILIDAANVDDSDVAENFFFCGGDIGHNRADTAASRMRDMNSCVVVSTDAEQASQITVLSGGSLEAAEQVSTTTRAQGVLFYWGLLRDHQACAFKDAGEVFTFKLNAQSQEKSLRFKPLSEAAGRLAEIIATHQRVKGVEVLMTLSSAEHYQVYYPSVSILGGLIVQDIIRSLSHIGDVMTSFLVVDTTAGSAASLEAFPIIT